MTSKYSPSWQGRMVAGVAVDLMTRLLWVTLYPQPGKREQWILLLYLIPSFYSVQNPNQWNGNAHIQGGSPSVSLCGNTLLGMPRGVSSGQQQRLATTSPTEAFQ